MWRRRTVAGVVGALALALPATAPATSLDSASTSTFVAASSRVEHAILVKLGPEEAAVNALIDHVESGCPGALPASLGTATAAQRRTFQAISGEALAEFSLALLDPTRSIQERAIRAMSPLRWTSATLNRKVAAFMREGRALLALHPPDICDQAKAAAASDFAVVPPATATFIRRYRTAAPASAPTVVGLAKMMKSVAGPQALAAIGKLDRLETRVSRALGRFTLSALGRLSRALVSQ